MEKYDSIPSLAEQQTGMRVFTFLVVLAQIFGLAAVVLVAVWMDHFRLGFAWHDDVAKEFNYHPLFMIIGMVFLYGNAIIAYRIFRNDKKIYIKLLHAGLQGLVLIFTGVGLKAVFDSHNFNAHGPVKNLYSLHSWLGLAAVILFALQWVMGFVTFLLPWCGSGIRAFFKPIHVYFGTAIYLLAIATALTGMTEKAHFVLENNYQNSPPEGILINVLGLFLVALAMTVTFIVVNPNYKRQPLPEEETIQLTQ